MKEFRVQLFRKSGFELNRGESLNLKIGRPTQYGYNCVDVYCTRKRFLSSKSKTILLGEIRKSGIDELLEKGALVSAKYYDKDLITIARLEPNEYREMPEYIAWREKLQKKIDSEKEADLKRMLEDLSKKTNPIDRHFLFETIVGETYRRRKDSKMRKVCKKIGAKHLSEFKELAPFLKQEFKGVIPKVTTFQYLSTVLFEDENYDLAIKVCKMAVSYNLNDGTKTGYEGRIKRIEKKRGQT